MDQCTRQIRLQHWKETILKCQSRPAGQTAKSWLKENGIREQTYYHWQRKIRQQAFAQMTETKHELTTVNPKDKIQDIAFAEIPLKEASANASSSASICQPVAIIRSERYSIAISNEISDSLLARILKEATHA